MKQVRIVLRFRGYKIEFVITRLKRLGFWGGNTAAPFPFGKSS